MRKPGNKKRGVALILVLLLAVLLLAALRSLMNVTQMGAQTSRNQHTQTALIFALEAGVADALNELDQDRDWAAGFTNKPLPGGQGSYSLAFGPGASVNNLTANQVTDGPRGRDSVAPFSADLIVSAEVNGMQRSVELLVTKRAMEPTAFGVTASRDVHLRGEVEIDGIESLSTGVETVAGIHSNRSDTVSDIVTWRRNAPSDEFEATGEVTASSTDPGAIDLDPGAVVDGGISTGAGSQPFPVDDIEATITAAASHPAPPVAAFGTTNLATGSYYQSGDLSVNGDLVLNGATLYVNGELSVNGSISGEGAVFVLRETSFRGDSRIQTNNPNGIALYSKGSVDLSGFDGSLYMETLGSSNAQVANAWNRSSSLLRELQNRMSNHNDRAFFPGGSQHTRATEIYSALAEPAGAGNNQVGRLIQALQAESSSGPRDFLLEKLTHIDAAFSDQWEYSTGPNRVAEITDNWLNGDQTLLGAFETAIDSSNSEFFGHMRALVSQLDFDRLGTAYFQGVIYSNGSIYASHEVSIVGSIWAKDDGTQSSRTVGGETLEAGDVFLDHGVRLTLNQEHVERQGGPFGAGLMQVQSWINL